MTGEIPYVTIITVYVLTFNVISTNSRTSTLWKLNVEEDKIVEASPFHQVVTVPGGGVHDGGQFVTEDDPIFNIITSTVHFGHSWTKQSGMDYYCSDCQHVTASAGGIVTTQGYNKIFNDKLLKNITNGLRDSMGGSTNIAGTLTADDEVLDCGKSVNYSFVDNLPGVAYRHLHPLVPEPEAMSFFTKRNKQNNKNQVVTEIDVNALERRLKRSKRDKPKSIQLYNQIGNFWRIKGDAYKSIECFRRALAVSPYNSEVLLNLAKVLFALEYYDDAIYVGHRSLEGLPRETIAWQHHYTLGEIYKACGRYQLSLFHFRQTLDLRSNFEPALRAIREIEAMPDAAIHMYTLIIIICLVVGVLLVIVASVDSDPQTELSEVKAQQQRHHFNRAMALRSLRRMSSLHSASTNNNGIQSHHKSNLRGGKKSTNG